MMYLYFTGAAIGFGLLSWFVFGMGRDFERMVIAQDRALNDVARLELQRQASMRTESVHRFMQDRSTMPSNSERN
jgi:hypothetical protein